MRTRKATAALALAMAFALGVSGCSSSDNKSGGSAAKNAALTSVVNPSTQKGGTVSMEYSDSPDSLDPGNTYYGWVQNFSRLYARTLLTFKPAAGGDGLTVVPDLATGLGKSSADAKTWTYTIRSGLKYDDGTAITTKDIKYAIERSNFAPDALSNGPTYFKSYLVGGDTYKGPYEDKSADGLASIETPNDTTIVFHLSKPFADFDYLALFSQTAPVPQAKDDGADYVKHIVSSGPYKFSSYQDGVGATLVRNPEWSQASDPVRTALPDQYKIKFKVNQTTIDNNLIAGNTTVDAGGTGVGTDTQAKVQSPSEIVNTDNSYAGATAYVAINQNVAPFDNIDCRKAVEYAIDKVSVQTAIGGSLKGEVATTMLPPTVNGYAKFDEYPTPEGKGDATKAKDALTSCGKAGGFSTNLAVRSDRPADVAEATAIQNSLKKVGINVTIKSYPTGKYASNYAGVPSYVKDNDLGLIISAWGADWPTGYGFLDQIVDGSTLRASGNTNLSGLNDPAINKALADAIANTDAAARTKAWGEIDKMVLDTATMVPLVYRKNLLYRPDSATNVTVTNAYLGMYDYLLMSSSK